MIFWNDGGETFNHWAHFMGSNLIVRIMEVGLFAGLLLHIIQGFVLWAQNTGARPVKYAMNDAKSNSTWYSRSMGLLGTLILLFLIIHLMNFWVPSRFGGMAGIHELKVINLSTYDNQEVHDLYSEMLKAFSYWPAVVIYVLGVFSLAWHLLHGFQSAFQTFGLNHKRWTPIIKGAGAAFAIIVPLLFALMPVAVYFQWVV